LARIHSIKLESQTSDRRPELVAVEFILDGHLPLEHCERVTSQTFDVISPIGWTLPEYQAAFVERLLLRQPALLPSGRRELLVCPECADLGCGCISADVSSDGDDFVWDEIGYENSDDPESLVIFPMGRFVIPQDELLHQIRRHVTELE